LSSATGASPEGFAPSVSIWPSCYSITSSALRGNNSLLLLAILMLLCLNQLLGLSHIISSFTNHVAISSLIDSLVMGLSFLKSCSIILNYEF
jgi:heme A synthase